MSKSTGNLIFVRDLLELHEPMVVRLAVMSQHYRAVEWSWTDDLLSEATARLSLWRSADGRSGPDPIEEVRSCLDDDLNVPAAVEALDEAAKANTNVEAGAALLGVSL